MAFCGLVMEIGDRVVLTVDGARANRAYWNAVSYAFPPLGVLAGIFSQHPEAGMRGEITDKRPRALGKPGHDYEVMWADKKFKKSGGRRFDWHLSRHLEKDPSDDPLPWEEHEPDKDT